MVLNVDSFLLNHMVSFSFVILPHSSRPPFFPSSVAIWGFFGCVARRPQAGTVDEGVLSRLLTPTQASLARSKSAALLSAEGTDAPGNLSIGEPGGMEEG